MTRHQPRRGSSGALVAVAGLLLALLLGFVMIFGLMSSATSEQLVEVVAAADAVARDNNRTQAENANGLGRPCLDGADASGAADILDPEQVSNARIIIDVTAAEGLPQRAAVIAVATAQQESSLRNVNHGDHAGPDSRGLFQQRLRYYATEGDPMDPRRATQMFLVRLVEVTNWDTRPLTEAAQRVQISAHPNLYAQWEALATDLVGQYWGLPCDETADAPEVTGGYSPPLAAHWYADNPGWFTKPHHDYPSADIPVPTGTDTYAVVAGVAQHVGGACGLRRRRRPPLHLLPPQHPNHRKRGPSHTRTETRRSRKHRQQLRPPPALRYPRGRRI